MSNLMTHGLSALMEACKMSAVAEGEDECLTQNVLESMDTDEMMELVSDVDDSVESDMEGEGGEDDDKMAKLLDKIPPDDEGIDEEISQLTESIIPDDLSYYYEY